MKLFVVLAVCACLSAALGFPGYADGSLGGAGWSVEIGMISGTGTLQVPGSTSNLSITELVCRGVLPFHSPGFAVSGQLGIGRSSASQPGSDGTTNSVALNVNYGMFGRTTLSAGVGLWHFGSPSITGDGVAVNANLECSVSENTRLFARAMGGLGEGSGTTWFDVQSELTLGIAYHDLVIGFRQETWSGADALGRSTTEDHSGLYLAYRL